MLVEPSLTAYDYQQDQDTGEDREERRLPGGAKNILQMRVKRMPKDFDGDPLAQRDFPFTLGDYRYRVQVARTRGRRQVILEGRIVSREEYGMDSFLERLPNGFSSDPLCKRGNSFYIDDYVYRANSFKTRGRRHIQLLGKAIPLVSESEKEVHNG